MEGRCLSASWSIARKIACLIPDYRNQLLVRHSYEEMVCRRVGQIMCGYEDANDCDRLFLYGAAYVTAYRLMSKAFSNTEVETFTMDSFMKRIMLSTVFIIEKKTFVRFSFSPTSQAP